MQAVKKMKNRKAPGIDSITAEALEACEKPMTEMLHKIFIIRQVIETAQEHRVRLHFNFVDFKAAFVTVWRKALWKMMIAIGIDLKIESSSKMHAKNWV